MIEIPISPKQHLKGNKTLTLPKGLLIFRLAGLQSCSESQRTICSWILTLSFDSRSLSRMDSSIKPSYEKMIGVNSLPYTNMYLMQAIFNLKVCSNHSIAHFTKHLLTDTQNICKYNAETWIMIHTLVLFFFPGSIIHFYWKI